MELQNTYQVLLDQISSTYAQGRHAAIKTIEEIGGEMPENLPVAGSIKRLGKQVEKKKVDSKNKKENDHS